LEMNIYLQLVSSKSNVNVFLITYEARVNS